MSVTDWMVPFTLSVNGGTLLFNQEVLFDNGTGIYLLIPDNCSMEIPLRFTDDNLPQSDGEQLGSRFFQGARMTLTVQLWASTEQPACDALLCEMTDTLAAFGRVCACSDTSRVYWTPDCADQRMLRDCMLSEPLQWTQAGVAAQASFQVKSPFPYAWTAAETVTALADGVATNVVNGGSADFWPVVKVYGPTSAFTLKNWTVSPGPMYLDYDASRPGAIAIPGGSYAEFDMFANTVYLDGDQNNLLPGIGMAVSDFWPLVIGNNLLQVDGANADILWQDAWA